MAIKRKKRKGISPLLFAEISDGASIKVLQQRVHIKNAEQRAEEKRQQLFKKTGSYEMPVPKILGVTGGIGSGKTFIMEYIKAKNVPIYISDFYAKKVSRSKSVLFKIKQTWSLKVLTKGVVDRKKLGAIVFENPEQMQKLNNIVHPEVKRHWKKWLIFHRNKPWVAKESAILLEVGGRSYCDVVIHVVAPLQTRIERIVQRDKITFGEAVSRINSQWDDQKRNDLSDFVIENISKDYAIDQLEKILKKIGLTEIK